ncbi:hypothetical protein OV079_10210 [Nannocystis pusilla]|uniref:Beta-ketoacyl synthase N-terminal domain-containing protein n=1 Tax=Nannocystis pusilla TaxID=889268 RepID=A0A9X3EKV5_9BACT|nr:hypothetical protein [Nannocystis pusilla]MCY1005933.1 hypothetical protein [Nannocystis pusilla]
MSVEVVAIAARTPVGLSAEASAAAVRARISRVAEFPFVAKNGEPIRAAADGRLDRRSHGRERMRVLAGTVAEGLVRKLCGTKPYPGPCKLHLELPEHRPGFQSADSEWAAAAIVTAARASFPALHARVSQRGRAGAGAAIESVLHEAEESDETLHLVIGVDSYHHPATLTWLEQRRMLAGPDVRAGLFPGEAAGGLALMHPRLRSRLRLPPLAVVRGAGSATEELGRDCDTGTFGHGMNTALARALRGMRLPEQAPDTVYLDINGERYRSEEWGFVALRSAHALRSLDYIAPADSWGDVGAASLPLLATLAVQAWARGYAKGPRGLVMCGSLGGLRGALALEDPRLDERRRR